MALPGWGTGAGHTPHSALPSPASWPEAACCWGVHFPHHQSPCRNMTEESLTEELPVGVQGQGQEHVGLLRVGQVAIVQGLVPPGQGPQSWVYSRVHLMRGKRAPWSLASSGGFFQDPSCTTPTGKSPAVPDLKDQAWVSRACLIFLTPAPSPVSRQPPWQGRCRYNTQGSSWCYSPPERVKPPPSLPAPRCLT